MTLEQATTYLFERKDAINLSHVAEWIDFDISNLHNAVNGVKDVKGYTKKIPKRCLPKLVKYIEWLKGGEVF